MTKTEKALQDTSWQDEPDLDEPSTVRPGQTIVRVLRPDGTTEPQPEPLLVTRTDPYPYYFNPERVTCPYGASHVHGLVDFWNDDTGVLFVIPDCCTVTVA